MVSSEQSFLIALDGNTISAIFSSGDSDEKGKEDFDQKKTDHLLPKISRRLSSGENLLLYSKELQAMQGEQDTSELNKYKTDNLMLVPVFNSSNEMIGVLGSINMKKHWSDCTLLECVSRNFLMALTNIRSYRKIEQIGLMDMLTGLRNRNCYEHPLEYYITKNVESLCCLYIDANGLHELNNTLGHAAGDEMLIYIGNSLKTIFGTQDTYRIGGDEFTYML